MALLFAGVIVMACGPTVAPSAQTSPAVSPTPTPLSQPTPTSQPAPTGGSASVTCSGGPGAAMAVVAGQFIYDVSDPVHPRLVCRTNNTYLHLLDGNAIAYTTVAARKVFIVRRDLSTGAESQIGQLPADPHGAKSWTSDGSLEVYATSLPRANGRFLVQIHLWSDGADHVLYSIDAGPGGVESHWSQLPMVEISPDHAYVAISDSTFTITSSNVRIFSVLDLRQKFVPGTAFGGTWIANDRFVWASASGSAMQWTPTGGAKLLRSERWFGPTSSSDGGWLAATLLTDTSKPRVLMVPVGGGRTFQAGLGSGPAFVTPTVVWYAEEGPSTGYDPTSPNGIVHSFDLTNGSNQVVQFRVGEKPIDTLCCTTSF